MSNNPTTLTESRQDNGSATSEPAPESLDKVRDILFGGQMRAVETRLQGLEARLLQAQENLRTEFTKQIDTLDGVLQTEVHGLTERLAAERSKRIEELKALATELKEVLREHEQRHRSSEASLGAADAELREGILQHSHAVANDLTRLSERFNAELTSSVAALKDEKTSRAALASLFNELAAQLSGSQAGPKP